jgi:general secretion pathway protein F
MLPMQVAPRGARRARCRDAATTRARRAAALVRPKTVTRDQLLALTRELATLLRAGLAARPRARSADRLSPIAAAGVAAAADPRRRARRQVAVAGARRAARVFSRFYVNIVRAGEAGGALGVVLTRLADTMERNKELRESVKSALIYPTILIGVAVLSVLVLLVWVVPQFEQTFAQAGKALPLPTTRSSSFSARRSAVVVGVGGVVVLASGGFAAACAARGAPRWDARTCGMPLIGDLVTKVEVARFARTLATLLGHGRHAARGSRDRERDAWQTYGLADALVGVIARRREGKASGVRSTRPASIRSSPCR